jgi:hypothetical protein
MPRPIHAGAYQDFMKKHYSSPHDMHAAAKITTAGVPRHQFAWGEFQKRVVPHRGSWPEVAASGGPINVFDDYDHHVAQTRAALKTVKNTDALSPDEPHHVPPTRLDLLDEAFRKAFYSTPPIPFVTDVVDAHGSQHDVNVDWDVDAAGKPTLLKVKIHCPVSHSGGPSGRKP